MTESPSRRTLSQVKFLTLQTAAGCGGKMLLPRNIVKKRMRAASLRTCSVVVWIPASLVNRRYASIWDDLALQVGLTGRASPTASGSAMGVISGRWR